MNYSLYPPVIDAQMPAFIAYDGTNVSFTLSAYNSPSSIGGIQVTVREMAGNTSVLNDYKYPAEIMDIPYTSLIQSLDQQTGETIYSFKLNYTSKTHVEQDDTNFAVNFVPGVYYKIQLRFFNHSYNRASGQDQPTDSDIANNLDNLSEWSTVCLLKGISRPTVYIDQFDSTQNITNSSNVSLEITTPQQLDISGSIQFASQTTTDRLQDLQPEYLSKYKITIYNKEEYSSPNSKPVYQSDWIITNDEIGNNRFEYSCYYDFQIDNYYYLFFEYVTNNDYSEKKSYYFKCIESIIEPLKGTVTVIPNEEFGSLDFTFKPDNDENYYGNITIRRASSKSEYLEWVDIYTTNVDFRQSEKRQDSISFSDTSVESNIFYRYCIQKRTVDGKRGQIIPKIEDEDSPYKDTFGTIPELAIFEHIFLTRGDRQLRVMLNPNISGFSYKVNEALTETIGSQYPYAMRNANTYYRTFTLSGTISALMDEYPDFERIYEYFDEDPETEKKPCFLHKYDNTGMELMDEAIYKHEHKDNFIISDDGLTLSRYGTDYSRAAAQDNPQTAIDTIKDPVADKKWDYHWYDEGIKNNFLDKKKFFQIDNEFNPLKDYPDIIYDEYEKYNKEHLITKYDDYIWETFFRQEVMDWLYENNVKLYRSATEGNIIVKLTDINFTPNQQLSRMIWDFSCTCTEVLPITYENLIKYGLCDPGKLQDTSETLYTTLKGKRYSISGFTNESPVRTKDNDIILQLESDLNATMEDKYHRRTLYKIYSLTIDMPAKGNPRIPANEEQYRAIPYLVDLSTKTRVNTISSSNENILGSKNLQYGFIIHINNEPVYIPSIGIYHIEDSRYGLDGLTSISILKDNMPDFEYSNPNNPGAIVIKSADEIGKMDFIVNTQYQYTVAEDTSVIATRTFDFDYFGQLNNLFAPQKMSVYDKQIIYSGDNIIDIIKKKYNVSINGNYSQTFEYLQEVDIEAPIGTYIVINDDLELVVGKSGHIVIKPKENDKIDIESIVFKGYKLYKVNDIYDEEFLQAGFYKEDSTVALKSAKPINEQPIIPEPNNVYFTDGNSSVISGTIEIDTSGIYGGIVIPSSNVVRVPDDSQYYGLAIGVSDLSNQVIYFNGELLSVDIDEQDESIIISKDIPALVNFRARFRGKEFNV